MLSLADRLTPQFCIGFLNAQTQKKRIGDYINRTILWWLATV